MKWRAEVSGSRWLAAAAALLALGLAMIALVQAAEPRRVDFDHLQTGFPLTGQHARASCESCHVNGVFKGTPNQCASCHIPGSRVAVSVKPPNHVPTNAPCDQCHTSAVTWSGARFPHFGVAPGSCAQCHNGSQSPGKPMNHVATTQSCDACHRTTAWVPAGFDHASVVPGTCAQCHNGSQAAGKPPNHVQTTASCDACHRTTAWVPAGFDHASVVPGTCAQCHNGSQATGKPSGHFVTSRSCDACHSTSAWRPVLAYAHTSPSFKPHNSGVSCVECHKGNSETIAWPFAAYQPDCAGCHASDFKTGSHKKTETPTTVFYTVSELRDCTGSCHLYTDNTFTTIKKARSGEHRSTGGDF